MRQNTGPTGVYVQTPNAVASPLVVTLTSTAPTRCDHPFTSGRSRSRPAKTSRTSRSARRTRPARWRSRRPRRGTRRRSRTVQVTAPKFAINVTSGVGKHDVAAADRSSSCMPKTRSAPRTHTSENVTVTLASSAPSVATTGLVDGHDRRGELLHGASRTGYRKSRAPRSSPRRTSAPRRTTYQYTTGTANIQVNTPSLTLGNFGALGIGQYSDNYFYVQAPDYQVNPLVVTLTHPGTVRTTAPPTVTILANPHELQYFRPHRPDGGDRTRLSHRRRRRRTIPPRGSPSSATGALIRPAAGPEGPFHVGDSVAVTIYARDPN